MYEWDDAKRRSNLAKHGVDFTAMARFDWSAAVFVEDTRVDYGERRLSVTGQIAGRLHICICSVRGDRLRIVSLRKANQREVAKWHDRKD